MGRRAYRLILLEDTASVHDSSWEVRNKARPEKPAAFPGAYLPQLQSLGHSLQALLASALHGQRELYKLIVEQLDPGNQAALAGYRVAPGAF